MTAIFRRGIALLAYACPLLLLLVTLLFAYVGEAWWVTGIGMYLPRLPFALAPLLLAALLLAAGLARLLWTQVVAGLIGLFALMGLAFPLFVANPAGPRLRIMSFNVNSENAGEERVVEQVFRVSPDVVLLQESASWKNVTGLLAARYPHVERDNELVVASRLPIRVREAPSRIPYYGRERSPRFMRYSIATPLGDVAFYNVHPLSPRESFAKLRGERGLKREILSGRLFQGKAAPEIQANSGLRQLQLEAVGARAARETGPVVLAGDMNQVGLSPGFRRNLGRYQDGFREAARGFGYTYPAKYPFMRLDRVLASDELRFTSFDWGCAGVSDHLCVVAELARAQP